MERYNALSSDEEPTREAIKEKRFVTVGHGSCDCVMFRDEMENDHYSLIA